MPSESLLPPGRLCLKFPMISQNSTSSFIQTFKHLSPRGTFKFQSTDCDTGLQGTSLEALESFLQFSRRFYVLFALFAAGLSLKPWVQQTLHGL